MSQPIRSLGVLGLAVAVFVVTPAGAGCPESLSVPMTSGGRGRIPVVFTGLGPRVDAVAFVLGRAEAPLSSFHEEPWIVPVGDLDGDGITDYRIEAPGRGPGGWGSSSAYDCPATMDPPLAPVAIVLRHDREDLDGDGRFDVFEDRNRNGRLDPGEDVDGDGRLTPTRSGPDTGGCEGILREDVDCDGHLDRIHEDDNRNGWLDPGEDRDGDRLLDRIDEDTNGNRRLDFFDVNRNGVYDLGEPTEDTNFNGELDSGGVCVDLFPPSPFCQRPYIEDRNNDQILNDRPEPAPTDVIFDVALDGTRRPLPPDYPYGGFHPAPGGLILGSIAWSGDAYDFSAITTSTVEADGGEDLDGDGAFDLSEDRNGNGRLDDGEDLDGDGRLTPAAGCEGRRREDTDCDGHLDLIHEDFDGDGVLDPGEDLDGDGRLDRIEEDFDGDRILDPGEDGNLNGRLDPGDRIEDRNRNRILDDRPFPGSDDVMVEHRPDGSTARIEASYPYGTFTPTGPARLARASPLERLAPGGSGAHLDPQGVWRLRLETAGVDLADDAGGTRDVIVAVRHSMDTVVIHFPYAVDEDWPYPVQSYFVETGEARILAPSKGNGGSGDFVSIVPAPAMIPSAWAGRPPAVTSTMLVVTIDGTRPLPASPWMQPMRRPIVDIEPDGVPIPEDNCPAIANPGQEDADADGIGDLCDPGHDPRAVLPDRWEAIAADGGPGRRSGAAAAFDEHRGVVVLFGGAASDAATWEFDGSSWRRVVTAETPDVRTGHRMVYDSQHRRILLFGGRRAADGTPSDGLWQYSGGRWSPVPVRQSPPSRWNAGLAFDTGRRRLVLFGGEADGRVLDDTWEFDAATWRRIPTPQAPRARSRHQMVHDPFRRLVILQGGGSSPSITDLNDTWAYDGASWQPVDHRGEIPATGGGTMVFDAPRRQTLVAGGEAGAWEDPAGPRTLLTAATRSFDGARWSALPTAATLPPRRDHAAAFDTARGLLVVHGGTGSAGALSDTRILRRAPDADGDGVPDAADNCPNAANPDQDDADGDNSGDRCDNCAGVLNATQRDRDGDGAGDACDDDLDGDGIANVADVCPDAYVAGRHIEAVLSGGGPDSDGDGMADDCDVCPLDPDDDTDGDGVCAGADNCPLAFNPAQENDDPGGFGDACRTTVRISPVQPFGGDDLATTVFLDSPDRDPISGSVTIGGTVTISDVLADLGQGCSLAYLPDGIPGAGIVYAAHPDAPVLADADSNLGCADGLPDYEMALGTCEEAAAQDGFTTMLTIRAAGTYPICVRGLQVAAGEGGPAAPREYTVWGLYPTAILLVPPGPPIIEILYEDTRLPNRVDLGPLPGPGLYVLRITADDGTTAVASDQALFARDRESTLRLDHDAGAPPHREYNASPPWPWMQAPGSAPTRSSPRSARGAWGRSTARRTRGSIGSSPSRCSRRISPPTPS